MKTLGKIKLTRLSENASDLKMREMNALRGGSASGICVCTCMEPSYPSSNYPMGSHSNSKS